MGIGLSEIPKTSVGIVLASARVSGVEVGVGFGVPVLVGTGVGVFVGVGVGVGVFVGAGVAVGSGVGVGVGKLKHDIDVLVGVVFTCQLPPSGTHE